MPCVIDVKLLLSLVWLWLIRESPKTIIRFGGTYIDCHNKYPSLWHGHIRIKILKFTRRKKAELFITYFDVIHHNEFVISFNKLDTLTTKVAFVNLPIKQNNASLVAMNNKCAVARQDRRQGYRFLYYNHYDFAMCKVSCCSSKVVIQ